MTTRPTLPQNLSISEGSLLCACDSLVDYTVADGGSNGTLTLDTENFVTSPALRVDITTPGTNKWIIVRKFLTFKRSTEKTISIFVHMYTPLSSGYSVRLRFFNSSGNSLYYDWHLGGTANLIDQYPENILFASLNDFIPVGAATWADTFTYLDIRIRAVDGQTCSVTFDHIWVGQENMPCVVIGFDDSRENVYTNAFPVMRDLGLRGTLYTVTGEIGTSGKQTLSQLKEMQSYGWDIANHCVGQPWLDTLTPEELSTELNGSINWLVENGFADGAYHIAYPAGRFNQDVIDAWIALGGLSGRTTLYSPILFPGPYSNYDYQLGAIGCAARTASQVISIIDGHVSAGRHVHFYIHGVENTASIDGIVWNLSEFSSVMSWLAQAQAGGKLQVVTNSELYHMRTNPRYRSLPVTRATV